MSWVTMSTPGRAVSGIRRVVSRVAGVIGVRRPLRRWSGKGDGAIPADRMMRKYQALISPLPRPAAHETDGQRWPATWKGVARAHHTRQLVTALVTAPDGRQPGRATLTVTMVVVGPGDCLDVGDGFTLWQGDDIARGVVTRRLFV